MKGTEIIEFNRAKVRCVWARDERECREMLWQLRQMLDGREMLVIEDCSEFWGRLWDGRAVLRPEQAAELCTAIVYGARSKHEMKQQANAIPLDVLLARGTGKAPIKAKPSPPAQSQVEKQKQWYAERARVKHHPHTLLRLEIQVAEHCNLNCRGCAHYAPIAEPEFLDLSEYDRDMARLGELFDHECRWIHLMGGEPLLHQEIAEVMEITRRHFSWGKVMIVTNGLLLRQMSDTFWQTCKKCDIEIYVMKYPVNCDYDNAEAIAKENNVKFKFYNDSHRLKTLFRWPLSVAGLEQPEDSFVRCNPANDCISLRHGRVYPCDLAQYSRHLTKKFNLPIHASNRDSIDIYRAQTAEEIMEFCARPIPFCRHCILKDRTEGYPFGQSSRDRYEWIDFEGNAADWEYLRGFEHVFLVTDDSPMGRYFMEKAAGQGLKPEMLCGAKNIAGTSRYDERVAYLLCFEDCQKRREAENILWDKQAVHIIPAYRIADVSKD